MELDSPERWVELKEKIQKKAALHDYYVDTYRAYQECVSRAPSRGSVLELGSGAGFVKKFIPEAITSDVLAYPETDQVVDATQMPFAPESLRAILMFNVFHHIPDVEKFLKESERCLVSGGRIMLRDQYPGWPSRFIYQYIHHEPFDVRASQWQFQTSGPLSGANGALPWIVFFRDREKFESLFPKLQIYKIKRHSPFFYWFSGGLKSWSLIPKFAIPFFQIFDQVLVTLLPFTASFMDVELVKR